MKSASSSSGAAMAQTFTSSLEHPKSQDMSCLTEELPLRKAKLSLLPMFLLALEAVMLSAMVDGVVVRRWKSAFRASVFGRSLCFVWDEDQKARQTVMTEVRGSASRGH